MTEFDDEFKKENIINNDKKYAMIEELINESYKESDLTKNELMDYLREIKEDSDKYLDLCK